MSYDNYHKEYTDRKDFSIGVMDYLKSILKNNKNKKFESEEDLELD